MKNSTKVILVVTSMILLTSALYYGFIMTNTPCHQPISEDDQLRFEKYELSKALVQIPEIELISQKNEQINLHHALDTEKPVFLQFVFTSCPTICPVLSSHFASFQEIAMSQGDEVMMMSVSIDPEYDNPKRLAEYAERFDALPNWHFYTGDKKDIGKLQASLKNYHDNKMYHRPATYYRDARTKSWYVYEGFISGDDLWVDYQEHVLL